MMIKSKNILKLKAMSKNIDKDKARCTLSDKELIEKSNDWVSKLAKSGGKAWTLRIPVDFNNDPDMLFVELGKRLESYSSEMLQKKISELEAELDLVYNDMTTIVEKCRGNQSKEPIVQDGEMKIISEYIDKIHKDISTENTQLSDMLREIVELTDKMMVSQNDFEYNIASVQRGNAITKAKKLLANTKEDEKVD